MNSRVMVALVFLMAFSNAKSQPVLLEIANDQHRPQVHFSPKAGWMNDPNGMVFFNDKYHLFYQHYPDSNVWGPMHWGHATSKDLIHWEHQPIALYPDSIGYIFSGSVVVDKDNSSGLGTDGATPLVALYTSHNKKAENDGKIDYQNQSMAYSVDDGKTWKKYANNPVLKNPGIRDFRDPKVSWYEAGKKWIMTLATDDCVTFYSSKDLKYWNRESDFGKTIGAHGGVWECPDLYATKFKGKLVYVLLVSMNPGGPNGGSATQYFIGDFDGKTFSPVDTKTRWLDYGPDNYAGITWSNTGDRKIFIGWMSNWEYANTVPTKRWRSAGTIPRELQLQQINNELLISSKPVAELNLLSGNKQVFNNIAANNFDLTAKTGSLTGPVRIELKSDKLDDFSVKFTNPQGEKLVVGFNKTMNNYFIYRSNSGKVDFNKSFAAKHTAPRLSSDNKADITLIVDKASIELFADNGLSVMTCVFFPNTDYSSINIESASGMIINSLDYTKLKSIYQ